MILQYNTAEDEWIRKGDLLIIIIHDINIVTGLEQCNTNVRQLSLLIKIAHAILTNDRSSSSVITVQFLSN